MTHVSCSWAPFIDDNHDYRPPVFEHLEEEVVNKADNSHYFLPVFPKPEPWTFKSQFAFVESEGLLYSPSAHIGKEDFPGLGLGVDLTIGEEEHGFLRFFSIAANHKGQMGAVFREENFQVGNRDSSGFLSLFVHYEPGGGYRQV